MRLLLLLLVVVVLPLVLIIPAAGPAAAAPAAAPAAASVADSRGFRRRRQDEALAAIDAPPPLRSRLSALLQLRRVAQAWRRGASLNELWRPILRESFAHTVRLQFPLRCFFRLVRV